MPRKLRTIKARVRALPAGAEHYLLHGDHDAALAHDPDSRWDVFKLGDRAHLEAVWRDVGSDVVTAWICEAPGTRPFGWWHVEAPEPRQRLGGVGSPLSALRNVAPTYRFGVPAHWFTAAEAAMYPGRGEPPDGLDPPLFESQAAYLDRLGLLTAAERRRLPADAFEPVFLDAVHAR